MAALGLTKIDVRSSWMYIATADDDNAADDDATDDD